LATSNRRPTVPSNSNPFDGNVRQKSYISCARLDTNVVELSAASHSRDCHDQRATGSSERDSDEGLLRSLILGVVGDGTSTVSKSLIDRYGSLAAVLRRFESYISSDTEISQALGCFLSALSRTMARVLRFETLSGPIIAGTKSLVTSLHYEMAHLDRESFRVLFLDSASHLRADETLWVGTVDRVQIHPREVIKRAMELHATALILVHNHPSGDPKPSRYDVAITNRMIDACATFDLAIHDHIIIARSGWFSMNAEGLLKYREGSGLGS
jgi:DNA repair protein RadC